MITSLGIYPIFATKWGRPRKGDRYTVRGRGRRCKRRKARGSRRERSLQRQEGQGCPSIDKLPSPLACPPVRLGSQLTVRGAQSSVLDRPAFLSPSLVHPRAGTRYMKKGPMLDPRAGEKRPEFSSTSAPSHDKITAQFHHSVWTLHFLTRTQALPFQACWSKIRHPCYVIINSSDHIFQTKKSGQIV